MRSIRSMLTVPAVARSVPRVLRLFLPVALVVTALYLFSQCAWYEREPERETIFGINFSCQQAQWLGYDCAVLFADLLDGLGVRHVRLSAYWSEIERRPGVYQFRSIDRLLDLAHSRGAVVTVTLGMKAQRHPEFWLPGWLAPRIEAPVRGYPEDTPALRAALFPYLAAAARHLGAHPAVEAIQVENEPFTAPKSTAQSWSIRPQFLLEEIAAVRAADPGGHPIVVNQGSWTRWDNRWRWILGTADVLGQSVYTKRQRGPWPWLHLHPFRWGWISPDLPDQARYAAARGKVVWLTELQAEPFEHPSIDPRRASAGQTASASPYALRRTIALARRTGATRAYFWGVEWWAYLRDRRDDPTLWEIGRQAIMGPGPSEAPRAPDSATR